ncbi:hypothetical protein CSV63_07240 [Sporosarcina sp. P34]|uniref:hypothetical protein n=1 Tax=Sporosarcina sp. P34 TaxID=2048247 RepID=UPI000C1676D3|nr:hypothetical protein [Sporosarcina sp. P34]PID15568.1 hypothetical protein CSV63_07240 [Sporosarcina sp. P34]
MENKLGRKDMQDWQEMTDALTARVYKSGFNAGYDAAKDETPDVEDMAKSLWDKYTPEGLSDLMMAIDELCPHVPIKSANEQRAELIQRAREFVQKYESVETGDLNFHIGNATAQLHFYKTEFVRKENKITALVRWMSHGTEVQSVVRHVGRSQCITGEVFNEWIGKAIALARALEIDIPKEFMNAVQPDEVVLGMVVGKFIHPDVDESYTSVVSKPGQYPRGGRLSAIDSDFVRLSTIIDDTNAQYGTDR